jgi:hypothetical protein
MKRRFWLCAIALLVCHGGPWALATTILPTPLATGPQFNDEYNVGKLFDEPVSLSDVGTTVYGLDQAVAGQWAGPGPGPHALFFDYGTTVDISGILYAQRAGAAAGDNDKVGEIQFWFSDVDFAGILPATAPDAVVNPSVPAPNSGLLLAYELGGLFTGRYVAASFLPLDPNINPAVNNIGGSELRFTVPEPSALVVLVFAGVGLAAVRRYRVG